MEITQKLTKAANKINDILEELEKDIAPIYIADIDLLRFTKADGTSIVSVHLKGEVYGN